MNFQMYSNKEEGGSFTKNYLANYINNENDIANMNSSYPNSKSMNNLLLKCEKEKEA